MDIKYRNGNHYVGEMKDQSFHGKGKMDYHSSGSYKTYDGQWDSGMFHGQGKLEYVHGGSYEGNFSNGKKHGHGTYKSNTWSYTGNWEHGAKSGFGTYTYPGGDMATGIFKDGERHGFGSYRWKDGTRMWRGQWANDKKAGAGIMSSIKKESSR